MRAYQLHELTLPLTHDTALRACPSWQLSDKLATYQPGNGERLLI
jgi:hypothetical protein